MQYTFEYIFKAFSVLLFSDFYLLPLCFLGLLQLVAIVKSLCGCPDSY